METKSWKHDEKLWEVVSRVWNAVMFEVLKSNLSSSAVPNSAVCWQQFMVMYAKEIAAVVGPPLLMLFDNEISITCTTDGSGTYSPPPPPCLWIECVWSLCKYFVFSKHTLFVCVCSSQSRCSFLWIQLLPSLTLHTSVHACNSSDGEDNFQWAKIWLEPVIDFRKIEGPSWEINIIRKLRAGFNANASKLLVVGQHGRSWAALVWVCQQKLSLSWI